MTDFPDYLEPQAVAGLLASGNPAGPPGGVPLLHGHGHLYNNPGQVLAVNGSFTAPNIVFTKPSYALRVTAQMSAAGAAAPTVSINLQWRSSSTGTANVDQQVWKIPAGSSSSTRTNIKGPVMGDTLNVTFTNGDAVDTCTILIDIYEGTWASSRHDGRSNGNASLGGASAAQSSPQGLIIANDSFSVPASSTLVKTLPLYAGQANIWLNQNTGAGSQVQINPTGDFSLPSINPVASLDWTVAPHQLVGVILPRCWCTAAFINGAAAPVTATFAITALEYAS